MLRFLELEMDGRYEGISENSSMFLLLHISELGLNQPLARFI